MRVFIFLAALLSASAAYAQDNIILRNGDEIPAKVLEVGQQELKYKKSSNPDGPVYTAPLSDVFLIKYANGTKDVFGGNGPRNDRPRPARRPEEMRGNRPMPAPGMRDIDQLRYRSRWFNRHFESGAGQRVSMQETASLMQMQSAAWQSFNRGRVLRNWSLATGISSAVLIGAGVGSALAGHWDNRGMMGRPDRQTQPANDPAGRDGHGRDRFMDRQAGAALVGSGVLLGLTSLWLNHRAAVSFRRAANRYNSKQATSLHITPGMQGVGVALKF
ncbi:hypothetical protein [Arsenicibacter rosenii]|uniref:DUF5683 domain-containing protein n=1 Tax=Arsenicibacter rosenii TaxID=1750698 RepID=A0A1S2VD17_9BACT|nr:hypothetical protein [Arsenicibacter rosenii]OIN56641.1 hypothetical protein BLX24_23715 [Arsenicibacter rosenii]